MENCPYCLKPLDDEDIICWYCGRDVVDFPDGAMPDLIESVETDWEAVREYGLRLSRLALLAAILSFSGVAPYTVGVALSMARKARNYLNPGDRGFGNIVLARILGWLLAVVVISAALFYAFIYAALRILMLR